MELDFKTVKALSSPTRIEILNEALNGEATPTELSKEIGKSKSTVSSHLKQLEEADLLEKESKEGRRRVVYQPTKKTESIINGRSRKVKFSIMSSITNAWIGLGLGLAALNRSEILRQESEQTGSMALDAGAEASRNAAESASAGGPENVLLFAGLGFLSIAVFGLLYGLVVSRIRVK